MLWQLPAGQKKIYLSFDDGPSPGVTNEIISILSQYNAKATFFMLGKNALDYPGLVQLIEARGHATGNHGFNHRNGWLTSTGAYLENARKAAEVVPGSNLFRPPYGRITPCQVNALRKTGMNVIMWSVLSPDYARITNPDSVLKKIISQTTDGSIVVFHDSQTAARNCLTLLPAFLEHFSKLGFTFDAIEVTRANKH